MTAPAGPQLSAAAALVPGILIGADSNPVTVARGTSATVNVRVTRVAGFTGAVTLAVDTAGVARGVRATIANATIAAGDTAGRAVTITVDTTATASATPTNIRISASGPGVTTQTLQIGIVVVNQVPGFTVAFVGTPTSALRVGQSGTVRVVVRRTGGFTGPVTFVADAAGLPGGVTVTQGATVGDTITLNIAAAQTATAGGPFNISLRGTGTGVTAQTLPLPLTVQPIGSFSISGTPNVAATPGSTITVPIQITRQGGFLGRLAFQTTGLPSGVTATFDTTATTATSDTSVALRLTVPTTLGPGTYPITVRGVTPGLADQTITINLNVPTPSFTIGGPASPLIILAGAGNAIQLPITRSGGFVDSVTFAVTGAPAGLTAQVTNVRPGASNTAATVNLTAEAGLAAGTYPITITGIAPDGSRQSVTTNVTVVANNASFGFQFQLPQSTVTVAAGATTTATVNVQRIASLAAYAVIFTQNVPRGLTVTLDRERSTGEAVTMTITAAPDLAPARYAFTITGATTLGPIPPVTVNVQVTPGATTTVVTGTP